MRIIKKEDGTLIVPKVVEHEGIIIDGVMEVNPGEEGYQEYLEEYNKEEQKD